MKTMRKYSILEMRQWVKNMRSPHLGDEKIKEWSTIAIQRDKVINGKTLKSE